MGMITLVTIFILVSVSGNQGLSVQNSQQRSSGRSVTLGETFMWKNGIVPFEISADMSEQDKLALFGAMRQISGRSCVRFKPNDGQQDYVLFSPAEAEGECKSKVGRQTGQQVVNLDGTVCPGEGHILYHLMRTLGFLNEHNRHDRDLYVRILNDNIINDKLSEFAKRPASEDNIIGVPYDYESVLHFDAYHHSKNELEDLMTIQPIYFHTPLALSGDRSLSRGDIQKLVRMYCPEFAGVKLCHASTNSSMCLSLETDGVETEVGLVHKHWFTSATQWTLNMENVWKENVGSRLVPRRQRITARDDDGVLVDPENVYVMGDTEDSLDFYPEDADNKSQIWFFKPVESSKRPNRKDKRNSLDVKFQIINLKSGKCLQKDKNNVVVLAPCASTGRKAAKAQQWVIFYADFYTYKFQ